MLKLSVFCDRILLIICSNKVLVKMSKKYVSLIISLFVLLVISSVTIVSFAGCEDELVSTNVIAKADCNNKIYGQIEKIYKYECWSMTDDCGYDDFNNYTSLEYDYYSEYEEVPYPDEIIIPDEIYIYEGYPITPQIEVVDDDYGHIDSSEYVVSYINNNKSGKATVIVDFIGNKYVGTLTKDFYIRPSKATIKSVKYVSKGKAKVSWKAQKDVSGYIVQYSTDKKFEKYYTFTSIVVSGADKTSKEISGLAQKTYYFRVFPYKTIDKTKYTGLSSASKSVKIKKGASLKEMINATKTDLSGRSAIKKLTNGKVDIKKYKTTYDRMRAIYSWHAKNSTKFSDCMQCNANFNECILALYGKNHCYDYSVWIGAGRFINRDGSKPIHKWSIIYISGEPYIFDPRIQGYGNKNGFEYFGFKTNSKRAKNEYLYDGLYFCQYSDYIEDIL